MLLSAVLTQKTQPLILHRAQVRLLIFIYQAVVLDCVLTLQFIQGYTIPPYYDSMIAKIIVHGENRFDALMKMQRALYELEIEGVVTNADFQLDLISDRRVIAGDYDTSFLMETFLPHYQEKE